MTSYERIYSLLTEVTSKERKAKRKSQWRSHPYTTKSGEKRVLKVQKTSAQQKVQPGNDELMGGVDTLPVEGGVKRTRVERPAPEHIGKGKMVHHTTSQPETAVDDTKNWKSDHHDPDTLAPKSVKRKTTVTVRDAGGGQHKNKRFPHPTDREISKEERAEIRKRTAKHVGPPSVKKEDRKEILSGKRDKRISSAPMSREELGRIGPGWDTPKLTKRLRARRDRGNR